MFGLPCSLTIFSSCRHWWVVCGIATVSGLLDPTAKTTKKGVAVSEVIEVAPPPKGLGGLGAWNLQHQQQNILCMFGLPCSLTIFSSCRHWWVVCGIATVSGLLDPTAKTTKKGVAVSEVIEVAPPYQHQSLSSWKAARRYQGHFVNCVKMKRGASKKVTCLQQLLYFQAIVWAADGWWQWLPSLVNNFLKLSVVSNASSKECH